MLVEHLVDRAVVAGCFDGGFATSGLLRELGETIVWQANLVLQVAVVVHDGNLQVPFVGVDSKVY